jgi:hypothetical protein
LLGVGSTPDIFGENWYFGRMNSSSVGSNAQVWKPISGDQSVFSLSICCALKLYARILLQESWVWLMLDLMGGKWVHRAVGFSSMGRNRSLLYSIHKDNMAHNSRVRRLFSTMICLLLFSFGITNFTKSVSCVYMSYGNVLCAFQLTLVCFK